MGPWITKLLETLLKLYPLPPGQEVISAENIPPSRVTLREDSKNSIFNQDFFGILSRILLPLALNNTLFRKSNFLVKGLVGILSQKASHFISEDTVVGLWDKVKGIFEKKNKNPDYGIPPESEAS